ncbi:MAG: DMT family transporter [Syntrophales bacterium]|nr:DMT family transporter [Syntrophales bacterium]
MNRNLKSHLAIIGANTIWGLNYVIAKGIIPDFLLPRAVVFLRVSGTLILFWILHFFLPSEKVEKKDLLKMALCSVFGVVTNQILFFEGLNRTTPISASIIATGIPIFILIFSYFILKEKITGVKVFGIMFGAAGALMIILSAGAGDFRLNTLLGNFMIFTSNASWALYLVLVKPLMEKYDPLTIMKWTFLFGFIIISPFSFRIVASSSFAQIPFDIWMSVLFVVFITTGFAYCLVNYSLKTVSPNVNGIYIYLQPLVASLVAIIWGKDKLTVIDLIAAVLIMAGVYLITRQPKLKNPQSPII